MIERGKKNITLENIGKTSLALKLSISWGALGKKIRSANLANARLELYSPGAVDEPYVIEII